MHSKTDVPPTVAHSKATSSLLHMRDGCVTIAACVRVYFLPKCVSCTAYAVRLKIVSAASKLGAVVFVII